MGTTFFPPARRVVAIGKHGGETGFFTSPAPGLPAAPETFFPPAEVEHYIMRTSITVCPSITTVTPAKQIAPANKNRVAISICMPAAGFVGLAEDPGNFLGPTAHYFSWPGNIVLDLGPPFAPQNALYAMGDGVTPVTVLEIVRVFGADFLQTQR